MLSTTVAVFLKFQPVRSILLILKGGVIPTLANGAFKSDELKHRTRYSNT